MPSSPFSATAYTNEFVERAPGRFPKNSITFSNVRRDSVGSVSTNLSLAGNLAGLILCWGMFACNYRQAKFSQHIYSTAVFSSKTTNYEVRELRLICLAVRLVRAHSAGYKIPLLGFSLNDKSRPPESFSIYVSVVSRYAFCRRRILIKGTWHDN